MNTSKHRLYRLLAFFLVCCQLLACQPPKIHTQSNPNSINVSQMPNLMDEPVMPAALSEMVLD